MRRRVRPWPQQRKHTTCSCQPGVGAVAACAQARAHQSSQLLQHILGCCRCCTVQGCCATTQRQPLSYPSALTVDLCCCCCVGALEEDGSLLHVHTLQASRSQVNFIRRPAFEVNVSRCGSMRQVCEHHSCTAMSQKRGNGGRWALSKAVAKPHQETQNQ